MDLFSKLFKPYAESEIEEDMRTVEEVDAIDLEEVAQTDAQESCNLFNQHSFATSRLWRAGISRDINGNWNRE